MPRKEEDIRASDFESEVRMPDLQRIQADINMGRKVKVFQCNICKRLYRDKSYHCPICNTKSMGTLSSIRQ